AEIMARPEGRALKRPLRTPANWTPPRVASDVLSTRSQRWLGVPDQTDRWSFSTGHGTTTRACLRLKPWAGAIRLPFIPRIAKTEWNDAGSCLAKTDPPKARSGFVVTTESIVGFLFASSRSAMKPDRLSDGTEQARTLKPSSKPKRD